MAYGMVYVEPFLQSIRPNLLIKQTRADMKDKYLLLLGSVNCNKKLFCRLRLKCKDAPLQRHKVTAGVITVTGVTLVEMTCSS